MKKLMIAAAVAMLGIAANAASCNWSTYAMDSGYNGLEGGTYWLIALGADTGASSAFTVFTDGTYDFGNYSVADTNTIPVGSYGAVSNKITGLGESDNGKYYALVVWDGKASDSVFGVAEGKITGIAEDPNPPADANDINFGTGGVLMATSATQPAGPGPIPEPTSGLLMLIGMGALALRRRRA